jgi:hypothetical protein
MVCRKGGRISIPGVYGGFLDLILVVVAFGAGDSRGQPNRVNLDDTADDFCKTFLAEL